MAAKYKPGDVILRCTPIAHALKQDSKGMRCDYCLTRSDSLKRCSRCAYMWYCNTTCQSNDWKTSGHKFECPIYKKCKGVDQVFLGDRHARLLLRLLLLSKNTDAKTAKRRLHNGKERCLADLMTHKDEVLRDPMKNISCQQVSARFKRYISESVSADEVDTLFCQMDVNSHALYPVDGPIDGPSCGVALYVEASGYDHSCKPNAVWITLGKEVEVRALTKLTDDDEVFINYIKTCDDRATRQRKLQSGFYFTCKCSRCESQDDEKLIMQYRKLDREFEMEGYSGNLCKAFCIGYEKIRVLTLIYGEYHPTLTGSMVELLQCGINAGLQAGNEKFAEIVDRVERSIEVTEIRGDQFYVKAKTSVALAKSLMV